MSGDSSPSDSPNPRVMQEAPERNSISSFPHMSAPSPTADNKHGSSHQREPKKPVLTFSIERILGLNRDSERHPVRHQNTYYDKSLMDEDYDDDEDDDDDDESICIDADDRTANVDHFRKSTNSEFAAFSDSSETPKYQWLQCTRYHPPKLQRSKKKEGTKKRKLGRNPRVPFTQHQVAVLEDKFRRTQYLSSLDVAELSGDLNLTETRVKIWFQNRRARERRDKEASQRNQTNMAQKAFQPLTIPSVAWPLSASMTSANYVQYQNALDFRSSYLSSAFGMYASREGGDVNRETGTNLVKCENKNRNFQADNSPGKQM